MSFSTYSFPVAFPVVIGKPGNIQFQLPNRTRTGNIKCPLSWSAKRGVGNVGIGTDRRYLFSLRRKYSSALSRMFSDVNIASTVDRHTVRRGYLGDIDTSTGFTVVQRVSPQSALLAPASHIQGVLVRR